MDERSLFWTEPSTLSRLLERLEAPLQAGTGRGQQTLLMPLRRAPRSRQDLAELAPVDGPVEERLNAFARELEDRIGCRQVFVVDEEGLPLVAGEVSQEMHVATAALGATWITLGRTASRPAEGYVAVDLENGDRLQIVTSQTPWGRLHLGLVITDPLTAPELEKICHGFEQMVEQRETEPS